MSFPEMMYIHPYNIAGSFSFFKSRKKVQYCKCNSSTATGHNNNNNIPIITINSFIYFKKTECTDTIMKKGDFEFVTVLLPLFHDCHSCFTSNTWTPDAFREWRYGVSDCTNSFLKNKSCCTATLGALRNIPLLTCCPTDQFQSAHMEPNGKTF